MKRFTWLLICLLPCLLVGQEASADRISDKEVDLLKDPIDGFSGVYIEEWIDDGGDDDAAGYDYFEPPMGYDYFERVVIMMESTLGTCTDSTAQVCSLRIWASSTDSTSFALDGAASTGTKCIPLNLAKCETATWTFDLKTPKVSLKAISDGDNITAFGYYKR